MSRDIDKKIPVKRNVSDVFKEYQLRLRNFISKRVDSKEDGEDILQNVFYQLAKADALMKPIDEITAWLYQVTRNQIIDWSRKKKDAEMPVVSNKEDSEYSFIEVTESMFEGMVSSPETEYLRTLVWEELDAALAELPDEQSNVFRLTELEGLSFKEISESTGIPVNTLISRKRYAVLHLRKRLKELYDDIADM
ncbi:RNA polymerase sigma factor [Dysgonomonas sp. OttesenSCG-928-M03]|nr:RNA polymerase sigma factor [Dysgonomonas sp. OttesenSCG-928-M03]